MQAQERIDLYLLDKMPDAERRSFEAEMVADPILAQEVKVQKEAIRATLLQGFETMLSEHTGLGATDSGRAKSKKSPYVMYAVAAMVLVAVALSLWTMRPTEHERLYSSFYTPDPGLPVTMGIQDSQGFVDGMVDYKQGDFESAKRKWQALEDAGAKNDTLEYYLAASAMALKEHEYAIERFQTMVIDYAHPFYEDAQWYLALLYLEKGDVASFEKIDIDSSSIYYRNWRLLKDRL